jgi:hypothetical protein
LAIAGCSHDVTLVRVQATFQRSFVRLYALQQNELGNASIHPGGFYATTSCQRGAAPGVNATVAQVGAGDDWTCVVQWELPSKVITQATYDLSVRTDGCFEATGPAEVVGGPMLADPTGQDFVNPLATIEACFST